MSKYHLRSSTGQGLFSKGRTNCAFQVSVQPCQLPKCPPNWNMDFEPYLLIKLNSRPSWIYFRVTIIAQWYFTEKIKTKTPQNIFFFFLHRLRLHHWSQRGTSRNDSLKHWSFGSFQWWLLMIWLQTVPAYLGISMASHQPTILHVDILQGYISEWQSHYIYSDTMATGCL